MSKKPITVTSCRFLVCENKNENLNSFADLVKNQNLRNIHFERKATTATALSASIAKMRPDIIYIDYDAIPEESIQTVNALRFGYVGKNPYLPVIFSSRHKSHTLQTALSSGVDMFLPSPFTFEELSRQILAIIGYRSPFIASHDYIGPQRNIANFSSNFSNFSSNNLKVTDQTFKVPNVFALKARGEPISSEEVHDMVTSTNAQVNSNILRNRAHIIRGIVTNIKETYNQQEMPFAHETPFAHVDKTKKTELQHLFNNALVSKIRLRNTPFTHIANMYESLMAIIVSIQKDKLAFNQRQIGLMQQTTHGIVHAFTDADETTIKQAADITETLRSYTKA